MRQRCRALLTRLINLVDLTLTLDGWVDSNFPAPNDTTYTPCSCHAGLANPVQIVLTPTVLGESRQCGPKHHTNGRQAQNTKGKYAYNCRLLPEYIVCRITQRNNIIRANTCDPALKLQNEEITSDYTK